MRKDVFPLGRGRSLVKSASIGAAVLSFGLIAFAVVAPPDRPSRALTAQAEPHLVEVSLERIQTSP